MQNAFQLPTYSLCRTGGIALTCKNCGNCVLAVCMCIQFVSMSNALLHEYPVSKFDNFMHFLALAVMFLLNN